jgi:hypothetical protein
MDEPYRYSRLAPNCCWLVGLRVLFKETNSKQLPTEARSRMVNRSCHILAVYSASPKAEKLREPWGQDCGSGLAPQFGGDTQDFTGTVVPCLTSYLASFERTRPVTEAIGARLLYHKTAGAPPLTICLCVSSRRQEVRSFRACGTLQRRFL